MADAMEAFRQGVHQEAADELVYRECHELVPLGTLDPVVLAFERDAHRVSCDQAAIERVVCIRREKPLEGRQPTARYFRPEAAAFD